MSNRLHIQGEYPADWDQIGDRVRAEARNRCIRCAHPYNAGENGKGEWSQCDSGCSHEGPFGARAPFGVEGRVVMITDYDYRCAMQGHGIYRPPIYAHWRILTVHHLDGNKANCEWWNLLALCQRCHLKIQTRLNPEIPYFLEHSDWIKPYAAGFYAKKYEGRLITREEAMIRIDELLAHERIA